MPPARNALAVNNWSTALPGGSGTLTVTRMTADRVTGTFSLVLAASGLNLPPFNGGSGSVLI